MFLIFISLFHLPLQAQMSSDSAIIIRDIQIRGNKTTKEHVILREMSLKIGDTLSQKAKDIDRNNIYNLRLFNKVDVEDSVYQNQATLIVTVSERWYFIPVPSSWHEIWRFVKTLLRCRGHASKFWRAKRKTLCVILFWI